MDPHSKLDIGDETEVAHALLGEHPGFAPAPEAPLSNCVFDEGALWKPDATGLWNMITEPETTRMVMGFSGMPRPNSNGTESPLKVGAGFASGVRRLVEGASATPGFFDGGQWGVAFRQTFLAIDEHGKAGLEPLTEKHRCRFALDFDYDPQAPAPREWIKFLRSLWGDDIEQINMLLEWIGYLLSGRTDFQKIFLMIGPTRSGKGTILRLIKKIFGHAAVQFKVAKLGRDRWMTGSMVGKAVAYDPDVRRASIHDSESEAVECMLSISGEDDVTCERKYEHATQTRLGVRLMMGTNPPFAIRDVGGALSHRLLLCEMTKSFLGVEDLGLDAKLAAEIPGIVRMAVLALQVLSKRGRFVEPASSAETRKIVEQAENPLLAFIEDRCEIADAGIDGFECKCDVLYTEFGNWCLANGTRRSSNSNFAATLRRLGVMKMKPRKEGSRARVYSGIKLLPAELPIGRPKVSADPKFQLPN